MGSQETSGTSISQHSQIFITSLQPSEVGALTATDYILDCENLQQAWKEELDLRPQPNLVKPSSMPQGKTVEAKTIRPNRASKDSVGNSGELIRPPREAEPGNDLAGAEESLPNAVAQAIELKDDEAEAALAAILAKRGHHEEAEGHYKRSVELARNTGNDVVEARALVELGRLLEDRGRTRRPAQAYLRVREIAKEAPPDSILWQYAQEANSRLAHLRHVSPEIDDIDPDEERRRDKRGNEVETSGQQAEERPDESIELSSISDVPTDMGSLGFKPYVEAISRFLASPDTKPPLTLSIEGEWGSGKSSFMLQLRKSVVGDPWWKRIKKTWVGAETIDPADSRASRPRRLWQAIEKKKRFAVRFNPWRHDKEDSLWAAFALEFLRQTRGSGSYSAAGGVAQNCSEPTIGGKRDGLNHCGPLRFGWP